MMNLIVCGRYVQTIAHVLDRLSHASHDLNHLNIHGYFTLHMKGKASDLNIILNPTALLATGLKSLPSKPFFEFKRLQILDLSCNLIAAIALFTFT